MSENSKKPALQQSSKMLLNLMDSLGAAQQALARAMLRGLGHFDSDERREIEEGIALVTVSCDLIIASGVIDRDRLADETMWAERIVARHLGLPIP